jgi:hypothetical protein
MAGDSARRWRGGEPFLSGHGLSSAGPGRPGLPGDAGACHAGLPPMTPLAYCWLLGSCRAGGVTGVHCRT